jgi:hypothetical protein
MAVLVDKDRNVICQVAYRAEQPIAHAAKMAKSVTGDRV